AAVVQVGHARVAGQRQRPVGRGEGVHVVDLLVGGPATVELGAVIRGHPGLDVVVGRVEHVVGAAEHLVGGAVPVGRPRFVDHARFGDAVDVGDVVRRRVAHARAVQPPGDVVAAGGQILARRRV